MPIIKNKQGYKINYEIVGNPDADETIILCHGNGNCLDDWKALGYIGTLEHDFRLVLMDALGYGQSEKPYDPSQYTPEKRSDDVIAVLDALKVDKCHFFGNSIGGSLGFVLAARYPQRFLSFSIGSAHPYGTAQPIGNNIYPQDFIDIMQQHGAEQFVAYVEKELLHKEFPKEVRKNFTQNDVRALACANKITWPDYSEYLPTISVPVLLFAGELDLVSKLLPQIAKTIPMCQVKILKGTDHADAYWNSAAVATLLTEFIHPHQFRRVKT